MPAIFFSNKFKKDSALARKQGKDMEKVKTAVDILSTGKKPPAGYKDHALIGDPAGWRECHLEYDWLLVYKVAAEEDAVIFHRLGTREHVL